MSDLQIGGKAHTGCMYSSDGMVARNESWDLPEETPIAIFINEACYAVMLATPLDLQDFVIGFCLSEGLVTGADKILSVQLKPKENGIEVMVRLTVEAIERYKVMERRRTLAGSSGCGLCGLSSLSQVNEKLQPIVSNMKISRSSIFNVLQQFEDYTPLRKSCYTVHAAVFVGLDGAVISAREDVGRHNALDKLIGDMASRNVDMGQGFLMITSRFAYELAQKCARLKIPIIVSMSAPTSKAVDIAKQTNMTLATFSGTESLMVFSEKQRIT